jgi:hypothetical protein
MIPSCRFNPPTRSKCFLFPNGKEQSGVVQNQSDNGGVSLNEKLGAADFRKLHNPFSHFKHSHTGCWQARRPFGDISSWAKLIGLRIVLVAFLRRAQPKIGAEITRRKQAFCVEPSLDSLSKALPPFRNSLRRAPSSYSAKPPIQKACCSRLKPPRIKSLSLPIQWSTSASQRTA